MSVNVHKCIINEIKYKLEYNYRYKTDNLDISNNIIIYSPSKSVKTELIAKYVASRILFFNEYFQTIKSPKFIIYYCELSCL